MATRRLRFALWHCHRRLKRQALAQVSAADHLIGVADALHAVGRLEAARRLINVALRFRVKAICLNAWADALNWRRPLLV